MRNTLVLVPLCIGLTSGFIVSTTTSEPNNLVEGLVKSKHVNLTAIDEQNKNNTIRSNDLELQQDIKHDHVRQQIYDEGSVKNKSIEERAFILLNQRWTKQPDKKNLVEKKPPINSHHLKKTSHLNVFQESPKDKIGPYTSASRAKYLNNKQEQYKEYNKIRKINTTISKHYSESKKDDKHNILMNNNEERTGWDKDVKNNKNDKYFFEFDDRKRILEVLKIKKQNKERDENASLYSYKKQGLDDEFFKFSVQRLFHLLLEEQDPHNPSIYNLNNSSWDKFHFCRKCGRTVEVSSHIQNKLDCKCGRYIHLNERAKPKS